MPATLPISPYAFADLQKKARLEAERRVLIMGAASGYQARGNIRRAQTMTDRELILAGPAGTGKSRGILEKLHRLLMRYPGVRVLMVRKTRKSLSESGLQTFEDHVLGPTNPLRNGPQRSHRDKYVYPLGGEFVIGGMDPDQKQRVMSTEFDIIYAQEATELTEEDWEALTTRLRNGKLPFQQMIGDVNPSSPNHWIKRRSEEGKLRMLTTSHKDNPRLWDDVCQDWTDFGRDYMMTLQGLSGVRYKRLYLGQWASAEGAVYDEWDTDHHILDPFLIPSSATRYISIDFGYRNPFVCQWWYRDRDGRLFRYRELYGTERLVEDWARDINALTGDERIAAVVCDHDAEGRATLERHLKLNGVKHTTAAKKPIVEGIQLVQARLKKQGDGFARLFLVRGGLVRADPTLVEAKHPISTEGEFESYVYPTGGDGKPNKKEIPVDEFNHGLDALRYMVAYFDWKAKTDQQSKPVQGTRSYQAW